jgi:hypothetical protein
MNERTAVEKTKKTRKKKKDDVNVEGTTTPTSGAKFYFTPKTQESICKFQKSADRKEREKLYVEDIMPAFEKLVENLINIHKFSSMYDSYEDLKSDCVNFLFETIHKFNSEMGTNAFSYFNVVAKNWLIIKTKQKAQKTKRSVSLSDIDSLTCSELKIIEEHNMVPSQDQELDKAAYATKILKMLYDIRAKVKVENELACINSVITIFENIDGVDILNKSAIFLYMRELSGLSPKQLTTSIQTIKKHYNKLKFNSLNEIFE